MSIVYIAEAGTKLGVEEHCLMVQYANGMKRTLPIETVESITLLTKAQVSTSCIESCLKRGIPVSFFSKNGRYFGRLL